MGIDALQGLNSAPLQTFKSYTTTPVQPNSVFTVQRNAATTFAQLCQAVVPDAKAVQTAPSTELKPSRIEFTPAGSMDEAAEYAQNLGVENYNMGDDLETANYVNEALTNLHNLYGGDVNMFPNIEVTDTVEFFIYNSDSKTLKINPQGFAENRQETDQFIKESMVAESANKNGAIGAWYHRALKGDFDMVDYIDKDFQKEVFDTVQAYLENPDSFDDFEATELEAMLCDMTNLSVRFRSTGNLTFERGYASGSKFSWIYHEYAHRLQSESMDSGEYRHGIREMSKADKAIAMRITEYAGKNYNEFTAETYKALINGHKLPEDVMALYKKCNGPQLP